MRGTKEGAGRERIGGEVIGGVAGINESVHSLLGFFTSVFKRRVAAGKKG